MKPNKVDLFLELFYNEEHILKYYFNSIFSWGEING